MIQRSHQAMPGALPSPELLRSVLREHARNCARLSRLSAYYDGAHDVTRRERRKGLPNTRIPHGYPAYISDMAAGYLIGSPIRYEYDPSDEIESLCQALRACDSPSVDAELAMQQSVFGRAAELCYADENARPRCIAVDPATPLWCTATTSWRARCLACTCAMKPTCAATVQGCA